MAPRALSRNRVQKTAASMFGQLSANYRADVLAENAGGIDELRAGDRVPDTGGLYDALDLNGLTLFVGNRADRVVDLARGWDSIVAVRDRPALDPDAWMLVRPDGYLAAAGDDAASLDRWLSRWFVKPQG